MTIQATFWAGIKTAIDKFSAERREFPFLVPDKPGGTFIRTTGTKQ